MPLPSHKVCSKCKIDKPAAEYSVRNQGRHLRSECRACATKMTAAWQAKNSDQAARAKREWAKKNRSKKSTSDRAYYAANRERLLVSRLEHARANPDQRAVVNARYASSPAGRKARAETESRRRVRLRGGLVEPYSRQEVVERDGGVCQICGDLITLELSGWDLGGFTIDHVTPVSLGGSDTLPNVRSAHRSCNTKRGARVGKELLDVA